MGSAHTGEHERRAGAYQLQHDDRPQRDHDTGRALPTPSLDLAPDRVEQRCAAKVQYALTAALAVPKPAAIWHDMLGIAHHALALRASDPPPSPDLEAATAEVEVFIDARRWQVKPGAPAITTLAAVLVSLRNLGWRIDTDVLTPTPPPPTTSPPGNSPTPPPPDPEPAPSNRSSSAPSCSRPPCARSAASPKNTTPPSATRPAPDARPSSVR
jgi:hypothetical protein